MSSALHTLARLLQATPESTLGQVLSVNAAGSARIATPGGAVQASAPAGTPLRPGQRVQIKNGIAYPLPATSGPAYPM